jgi:membrane protease YdiL (CAAX protease family)
MGPAPITGFFLLTSLSVVLLLEAAAAVVGTRLPVSPMALIAATRLLQLSAVIGLAAGRPRGLRDLGLDMDRLKSGVVTGMAWSAVFAAIVGAVAAALMLGGRDPLALVHMPLPTAPGQIVLFFLVGGIVGPAAEEVVFRGVVFGYLKRWGPWTSVIGTTALFAMVHRGPGLPLTQIVGGLVFALAYHRSGSLAAPMIIHMLGNLALFTLSL